MTSRFTRRHALLAAASLASLAGPGARAAEQPSPEPQPDSIGAGWQDFKRRFLVDGRIVDTGNGGVSHTEGQGWGLLFATATNDAASFDAILDWTTAHLQRPHDALHAWRYRPGAASPVDDPNNATDGDLLIAWALMRGARLWRRPALRERARAIAADILRLAMRLVASRFVLLPGVTGFERPDGVIVNPSYSLFPAFPLLAEAAPSPLWDHLTRDGAAIIDANRFGQWMLPPDWLFLSTKGAPSHPAPGFPPRFSYDAIRVPLYLAWGRIQAASVQTAAAAYWNHRTPPSAWVDLVSGQEAPYAAPAGMQAAMAVANPVPHAPLPPLDPTADYYSSALSLLARVAAADLAITR